MSGLFGGSQSIATSETPLAGLNIQSSAYGKPVPLLYGRNRIAGNLLWYGDFAAIPHTTSSEASGGKGGGGITTTNTTYTYQASFALGLGEGPATSINAYWLDKEYHADANVFTKFLGSYSQAAWSYLTSVHPTEALAYRGTAYVAAAAYDLGGSASLGNHSFDITGLLPYAAGTIDGADPRDIATDVLTNAHYGAGFPAGYLGNWASYSAWCVANDVFLSPSYETQGEARQAITDLLRLTNAGIFFSEGLLKIVPFSDTAATAHGVTYTPNVTPAYDLTDDDFLDLEQPVRVMRTPNADAYNQVKIEFLDGASQFNVAIADANDQASIELHGLRPMETIVAHSITDAATARLIAQLILQRAMYTRNVYEFKIGWRYARLEPCDYVTLTDERLGLAAVPVRILSVEEDDAGTLTIGAEDAPAGIHSSPLYAPPSGDGYVVDFSVAPGDVVTPAFFEIPATKALSGLAIGIAVTGSSIEWGGCEIWGSNDGTSYAYVGQVAGGARYGTIGSGITEAAGQVARVTLAGNGGQILSGSAADADNLSTLALIDNEFVAFTTSALVSANVYDLTLAERGVHNTVAAAHSGGDAFVRVDDAIAYSDDLELDIIGKTIYFKFLSFNRYGGGKQRISDVAAYPYTVTGTMAKLAPATVSGFSATAGQNTIFLQWSNPADMSWVREIEVWRNTIDDSSTATRIGSVKGAIGFYADVVGATNLLRYYWIRTVNQQGYPSAFSAVASATSGTVIPGEGSIVAEMIAADQILAVHLAADAVTANKIAAGAVSADKMETGTITAESGIIADAAITTAKIEDANITTLKVAGNAITIPIAASGTTTATTAAWTFDGATKVAIIAMAYFGENCTNESLIVTRGATTVLSRAVTPGSSLTACIIETPPQGSTTYTVSTQGATTAAAVDIIIIGCQR